jgi:hypothetical protein
MELTPEEYDRLLKSGYCKIDDPIRGEIEVRLLFDELHPGIKGKQIRVSVIRPGTAVTSRPLKPGEE